MNKKLPLIVVSAGSHKSKWMFLMSLLAGCALTALPGFAQTTTTNTPKPVVVVNPTSTPVPTAAQGTTTVAGTVNIGNAPNVNVTNTPSVNVANTPNVNIANTPSVSLVGSPTVTMAPGSSTAVTNPLDSQNNAIPLAGTEGTQFYDDRCTLTFGGIPGNPTIGQCNFKALPAGKRLVIQEFDNVLDVDAGIKPRPVAVSAVGLVGGVIGTIEHFFPLTLVGSDGILDSYATHQPTHLYASSAPTCSMKVSALPTDGSATCAISGFLLDAN